LNKETGFAGVCCDLLKAALNCGDAPRDRVSPLLLLAQD
jgi:hypothetical protein